MARVLLSVLTLAVANTCLAHAPASAADFDRDVRPILSAKCYSCHGPVKQRGGLRLDRMTEAVRGGETGPAFVPGNGKESLLIRKVSSSDPQVRMPPNGNPLAQEQIAALRQWIDDGAKAPPDDEKAMLPGADNWALTQLKRPAIPATPAEYSNWVRNPVDAFVLQKLLSNGLSPSQEADRRTLIRRLSVDLTGLLPNPDEIEAFQKDSSASAYEHLVDRLLASPHYGERWARHWLDVVHYADSHGHDEDGPRPNAWPYRDYLIRSFNDDKPYARFIKEQIAGDVLFPDDAGALVAPGFLAAGPWDQSGLAGIREDTVDRIIAYYLDRDDMVTTTFSTFAGLTVGCARCHDHKFDPITTSDYYALQAVFAGLNRMDRAYDVDPAVRRQRAELQQSLASARTWRSQPGPALISLIRQDEAAKFEASWRDAEKQWIVPDTLAVISKNGANLKPLLDRSILSLGPRPDKDTYTIRFATDLVKVTGIRLEVISDETLPKSGPGRADNGNLHLTEVRATAQAKGDDGPGVPLKLKAAIADFDQAGWGVARTIDGDTATAWGIHPAVGQSHRAIFEFDQPVGFPNGTQLTVELDQLHGASHLIGRFRLAITTAAAPLKAENDILPAPVAGAFTVSPTWRTDHQKSIIAGYVWEQRLHRELAALPQPSRVYCGSNQVKADGPVMSPRPVHVLKRGDVTKPGELAVPGSVTALSGLPARFKLVDPNDEGLRRIALSDWLAHTNNPLTWRVIVNRAWHYHFGKGIVATPNDFGKMGAAPSHPELLDWLAVEFRDGGGSLKKLHRLLVTSNTYRQSVRRDANAISKDVENGWLWRMNRTRIDAESVRDSVLRLAGRLDETMYGPPDQHFISKPGVHVTPEADYDAFDVDAPAARRRSIYRYIFRTRPDPMLEALDCPDASQSAPARATSVSALQALALWNNKFTLRHAEHLAALAANKSANLSEQIQFVSRQLFGRVPGNDESAEWIAHANRHGLANLCRVLLNSSEFLFID